MSAISHGEQLALAEKYADENIEELALELLQYNKSTLIGDGKLRKLWTMLKFSGSSSQSLAISIVHSCSLKQVSALKREMAQDKRDALRLAFVLECGLPELYRHAGVESYAYPYQVRMTRTAKEAIDAAIAAKKDGV